MRGVVTFVAHSKGYGFARGEDGAERFLHADDFLDPGDWPKLRIGVAVEFEPRVREKGKGNKLGCSKTALVSRETHKK